MASEAKPSPRLCAPPTLSSADEGSASNSTPRVEGETWLKSGLSRSCWSGLTVYNGNQCPFENSIKP